MTNGLFYEARENSSACRAVTPIRSDILRGRIRSYIVAGLLVVHSGLLAYSATRHSPTDLEPAFLAAGIDHWGTGRFGLFRVNPPLPRLVAALPVLAAGCKIKSRPVDETPGARQEFDAGADFIRVNADRSLSLLIYARWACIPFSLIGGYVAYRWATELYGSAGGLVSLVLWCTEPNLMAHAELATADSACTAFGLAAGYCFWVWLKRPSWNAAGVAGLMLGLAELSKLSWFFLFALWPILWIAWRAMGRGNSHAEDMGNQCATSRQVLQLAAILMLAAGVVNFGYLFRGTLTQLEEFKFVSRMMTGMNRSGEPGNRFADSVIGRCPIPFPQDYVLGFDRQKQDFEASVRRSYLRGEWSDRGWWHYYAYGLLVKVPCGTWFMLGLAIACRISGWKPRAQIRDELVLLSPAMVIFVLVSSETSFNQHLRYVYPSLGLSLVFIGQVAHLLSPKRRLAAVLTLSLLGYSVISAVSNYPHQLAYFNEFAGGPRNGFRHLLGSSVAWSQDGLLAGNFVSAENIAAPWYLDASVRVPVDCDVRPTVVDLEVLDALCANRARFGRSISLIASVTSLSRYGCDPQMTQGAIRAQLSAVWANLHDASALSRLGARRIGLSLVYVALALPGEDAIKESTAANVADDAAPSARLAMLPAKPGAQEE